MAVKRKTRDRYSKAISYFRDLYKRDPNQFRAEILNAWSRPYSVNGCLFLPIARHNNPNLREDSPLVDGYGCATQIRVNNMHLVAATPELTKMIQNDQNIPSNPSDINVDILKHFAKYQRLADKAPKVYVNPMLGFKI